MLKEDYKLLIIKAVDESRKEKEKTLDLLATHLEEVDLAKQVLRDKGYGWGGLSLLETVSSPELGISSEIIFRGRCVSHIETGQILGQKIVELRRFDDPLTSVTTILLVLANNTKVELTMPL